MEMEITNVPLVVLSGISVLPGVVTMLEVSRKQSIDSINEAASGNKTAAFFMPRQESEKDRKRTDQSDINSLKGLCPLGVTGKVSFVQKTARDTLRVTVEGLERVELLALSDGRATVSERHMEMTFPDDELSEDEEAAIREMLEDRFTECIECYPKNLGVGSLKGILQADVSTELLMNVMAAKLPFKNYKKYHYLTITSAAERAYYLIGMLDDEIKSFEIKNEINAKVKERIDKNQRDFVLREQMKVIADTLGDGSADKELSERLEKLDAPEEILDKIKKNIEKLKTQPFGSQEGVVLRNYIEVLLDMPWNKKTEEQLELGEAKRILEEDHYGLDKVKERILEYLAVRKLNGGNESTILCLVGPPGTGKTSIAKSIARALNRKYVRISLGGVHDEAEIRGHRKTYIGAMPGRIANAIKQAGVSNPLILLDELDKLGSDHRGDPASALLEVLDSEQNVSFRDNYLELPIDLSTCIFIATANDASTIPGPLRDRVEMLEVSSYTANEKLHIAKQYLIEKQREKHGLKSSQFSITDEALNTLIHSYTKEAGVRELERKLGALCRKAARLILEEKKDTVAVDERDLEGLLGRAIYREDRINHEPQVGIVHGLAWTSVGGDTLEIEVNVMPGKGILQLTGKLGDVMKESAQTALSFVRSVSEDYGVPSDYYEKHDIHLHVPEGAVPKDGPSAGITIATAMLSAVTKRPVRGDVAMTGEITLRGSVLPIGGLKEKLLAAGDAGMTKVLVPAANESDVSEISEEITGRLDISFIKNMSEVLEGVSV